MCVAKGVDALEVAGEHSITTVENPLARALHASVEVDSAIEHYKAVAEVIGYVMRLRRAVRR